VRIGSAIGQTDGCSGGKGCKGPPAPAGEAAEPGRLYVKHICFVYRLHTFDRHCQLRNNMGKLRSSGEARLARTTSRGRGHQSFPAGPKLLVRPRTPVLAPAATLSEKIYRALKRDITRAVYLPGAQPHHAIQGQGSGSHEFTRPAGLNKYPRSSERKGHFRVPARAEILNERRA
jgi:hypothetical protein